MRQKVPNMTQALHAAGLTEIPRGKKFTFVAEHGSHRHELKGHIQSVSWSDEGGLKFFVDVPEFWGRPLRCFMLHRGSWQAYMKLDKKDLDDVSGTAGVAEGSDPEQAVLDMHLASQFVAGTLTLE